MEAELDNLNNNNEYKECLRNHAASLGSYATDGCGEYTTDVTGTTGADTTYSLQCAACGCHRNFHRRVTVNYSTRVSCSSSGQQGDTTSQEWEVVRRLPSSSSSKKRFRTKFTEEQKEKMLEFAERLGWKMQRGKEEGNEIERFCKGIGVSRKVFKVWMHNHKNNSSYSSST